MHRDIFGIRIASLSPSDINTAWGQTFAHLLAYKFDKVMNSDWPLDIVYREKSFFYDGESRHFMVLHILYRKFKRQHMHLYNDFIYFIGY